MLKLAFSTKGKTLEDLSKVITVAKVLPILRFSVGDFKNSRDNVADNIQRFFKKEPFIIIRSSAKSEDTSITSNAGRFKSVPEIPVNQRHKIVEAVDEVIVSYGALNEDDEILIQPMLSDIKISGVVLTADLDTLGPYYIINYDEHGIIGGITGGKEGNIKTYIYFKNSPFEIPVPYLSELCKVCKKLEDIFNNKFLDVEFAFDTKGDLYILQVRPISIKNKEDLSQINLCDPLSKLYRKIKEISSTHPNLLCDRTMFGVMPDWNPAEMIGLRPKQLALSLYKELITDNVWAYQRDNYGYRNLRSHPLLVSFLGISYIDLRVDFNSFVPKNLNDRIAEKLVDYYLKKLESIPAHHDKVEFEIVHSCYYLNLPHKLKELLNYGFNENEIKRIEFALLELTNNIIDPNHGLYKKDLEKIEILKEKYDKVITSNLSLIDKIYWLIEECKRYGTLPFAGVARAAFIAIQFMKSFVAMDIITQSDYDRFMNSLNTIAKKMNNDSDRLSKGHISKEDFLFLYGHLRPGTYDILSLRYDKNFEYYFSAIKTNHRNAPYFRLTSEQMERIDSILSENGIKVRSHELMQFFKEAIEGREYAKFIFTKSVSEVLYLIEKLGQELAISREDLAYLDIKTVLNLYSVLDHRSIKDIFLSDIEKNKEFYKYTKAIKLPALIKKTEDVYGFFIENEEPSFITFNRVKAHIMTEDEFNKDAEIDNKIVLIRAADPGYDFLFSKNIAGLVTQFGGANSHMAIRCAELGIPAVIGVGEKNFSAWSKVSMLEIDCANRKVEIVL